MVAEPIESKSDPVASKAQPRAGKRWCITKRQPIFNCGACLLASRLSSSHSNVRGSDFLESIFSKSVCPCPFVCKTIRFFYKTKIRHSLSLNGGSRRPRPLFVG